MAALEWLHWNGIAYPIGASNISKVWMFEGKFKVVTKVQRALSKPYKDGTQYITYDELVYDNEEIFKKVCEKLGCNFEKIKQVNHQKFNNGGGQNRSSYSKSSNDEDVPF